MRSGKWRMVVVGLALGTLLGATAGTPAAAAEEGYWSDAGLGVGAIIANVGYMPAKFLYAALGTVTGGLTYALTGGSYETAEDVWVASLGGSYVIVPAMLTGEQPIEFSGTPRSDGSITEGPTSLAQEPAGLRDSYAVDHPY